MPYRLEKSIEDIKQNIKFESLLKNISVDDYLDCRDKNYFDKNWMDSYKKIILYKDNLSDEEIKIIDSFREIIFKKVFTVTKDGEVSSYISDDFELFILNNYFSLNNYWIDKLYGFYMQNILFCEEIIRNLD